MMMKEIIPHYISSFDLEEARLGQAIQKTKIELSAEVLKKILRIVKKDSVNAEFAALTIAHQLDASNSLEVIEIQKYLTLFKH